MRSALVSEPAVLQSNERPGGYEFERAYWWLLDFGMVDSDRDLWCFSDAEEQAYLERYAQPWWDALHARLEDDGLRGHHFPGGYSLLASAGVPWTTARFHLVRPDGSGFGWDLSTSFRRARDEMIAAYGEVLERARKRQHARLVELGFSIPDPPSVPDYPDRPEPEPSLGAMARLRAKWGSLLRRDRA